MKLNFLTHVTVYSKDYRLYPKLSITRTNTNYVDLVRFISMIGVVWLHSYITPHGRDLFPAKTDHPLVFICSVQLWKFSTINFFIISGFLLGEKLNVQEGFLFFKNRIKNIMKPYLAAFLISFCYFSLTPNIYSFKTSPLQLFDELLSQTSFWFVPNMLFALLLIILLLKTTNLYFTGFITLLLTISSTVYAVYLKHQMHTEVFIAYAFYLWLGVFINKRNLMQKVFSLDMNLLILLLIVTFLCASYESYYLEIKHSPITFNTLCFSNQLFSIAAFLFIIRASNYISIPAFLNVRQETFGIYLYHVITLSILSYVYYLLYKFFNINVRSYGTLPTLLISVTNFFIVYTSTTLLVKYLSKKKVLFL